MSDRLDPIARSYRTQRNNARADYREVKAKLEKALEALEKISKMGTDCPAGEDPTERYRHLVYKCIGIATLAFLEGDERGETTERG